MVEYNETCYECDGWELKITPILNSSQEWDQNKFVKVQCLNCGETWEDFID